MVTLNDYNPEKATADLKQASDELRKRLLDVDKTIQLLKKEVVTKTILQNQLNELYDRITQLVLYEKIYIEDQKRGNLDDEL